MKKLLAILFVVLFANQASAEGNIVDPFDEEQTVFVGKEAIQLLEKGIIIAESADSDIDGQTGEFLKDFSVIYKGDLYQCRVWKTLNLVSSFCISELVNN